MPDREKPTMCRPLSLTNILSGNQERGYTADHLARHRASGVVWRSRDATNVYAVGEFEAGASTIDMAALVLTNAQAATTIRLRLGNSVDEATAGTLYDSGIQLIRFPAPAVEREDGLSHWHFELPSPVTATHWRIDIENHAGAFEASSLILGAKIQPSHFYDQGYGFGSSDLGDLDIGQWGVLEDSGGVVLRTLEFALAWEDELSFETQFRPLMESLGQRELLYCCFDPAASEYRQARTYMGVLERPLVARGVRKPKTYSQEFRIVSII